MLRGMNTRSRRSGSETQDSSSWIHHVASTPTRAKQTHEEFRFQDVMSPVIFSGNYLAPNTSISLVQAHRPALISPSPDDFAAFPTSTATTNKRIVSAIGPEIPHVEELSDFVPPTFAPQQALEPVLKRARVEESSAFTSDFCRVAFDTFPTRLQQEQNTGTGGDERVNRAASVLTQLRQSSISSIDCDNKKDIDIVTDGNNSRGGLRLALPQDAEFLNSLHCFVRSELLEVFETTASNDVDSKTKRPRVGLRCVFCVDENDKATMASFYPKSLQDLYRTVCTWQRVHFQACKHIPSHIQDTYKKIKKQDRSRGKTKYWVTSAQQLGIQDLNHHRCGICFATNTGAP